MLYALGCRLYQLAVKYANYLLEYRTAETMEGPGCVRRIPELLSKCKYNRILVVTDNALMKLGLLNGMLASFDQEGIPYALFSQVAPNPTLENVEAGYRVYRENHCDALLAFGGGSPIDCAKAIAVLSVKPGKNFTKMQGLLKVRKKIPLLIAVPTTSGTGSETTIATVITDTESHHKIAVSDPVLTPRYAVLDPELTIGLPPAITASTGMDALCHAVESYTNGIYGTKLENELARKAVRLVYDNLLTVYHDGSNLEARQNMQKASFYAGRSFTRGAVGNVHAMGHTLSGLYNMPHGLTMAILLPHVLRQNGPAMHKKLAELAEVCGMSGSSQEEKAMAFIRWIEDCNREMGIPAVIQGIREEDIPQMVRWAEKEANPLYPVPVIWRTGDFEKLIRTVRAS